MHTFGVVILRCIGWRSGWNFISKKRVNTHDGRKNIFSDTYSGGNKGKGDSTCRCTGLGSLKKICVGS